MKFQRVAMGNAATNWEGRSEATESVGRASARQITRILRADQAALGESDYRHMRKVVGFIRRHRAQEPANIVTSRWRWSLMNWGHDPLKV